MTLYQEIPKTSLDSELKKKYSSDELDEVRSYLPALLQECRTLSELHQKLSFLIERKTYLETFRREYKDNFLGI